MSETALRTSPGDDAAASGFLGVASRDLSRLRTVARAVVKHGFGELLISTGIGGRLLNKEEPLEGDAEISALPAPERFCHLLESLGPTYIKLGQILSTRPDRIPKEWITALQSLQDDVAHVPPELIVAEVERSLGRPIGEVYAYFDRSPLATASIAQTHRARTHEGEEVVVKVRRPGVGEMMRGDLDLLYLGAKALEASIEEMKIYGPAEVVAEFESSLIRELNFHSELENLHTARAFLDPKRRMVVPKPFPALSSRTVLTMEFFPGKSLRSVETGSPRGQAAAKEIVEIACKQVLFDGFVHGDPHSGNILINDDDVLCMIDLGLVARLSKAQQDSLIALIIAMMTEDVDAIARTLLEMGRPTERVNMAEFKAEVVRIKSEFVDGADLQNFNVGGFIQAFTEAAQHFRIKLNSEYSVLAKATITLDGVIRSLDPNVDIKTIGRPYAERLVKERFSPERLMQGAVNNASQMGALVQRLPAQLDQLLHDLETGHLQIQARTPELKGTVASINQLTSRVVLVGFAATMSLCAALLLPNDPTRVLGIPVLSVICILLAFFTWTGLISWQLIGGGRPIRLGPLVRLFRGGGE